MNLRDERDILKHIDESNLFYQIEEMTLKELRQYLEKKRFCNLYDLLTISFITFKLLKGQETVTLKNLMENKELIEIKFAYKYGLTKDEVETLKLLAEGFSNRKIADSLNISITVEGIAKRVSKILRKLGVHNRQEAAKKAIKEKLI